MLTVRRHTAELIDVANDIFGLHPARGRNHGPDERRRLEGAARRLAAVLPEYAAPRALHVDLPPSVAKSRSQRWLSVILSLRRWGV